MIRFFSRVLTLAEKDLRLELRSKEALLATLLFVILVLFIFNFSFGAYPELVEKLAPGILWVTIAFSGTIAITHLARRDHDDRVQEGLLLTGIGGVTSFFAKFISALVFMLGIEMVAVPLFIVFFNYSFTTGTSLLACILALGTIGFSAVGTLFASLLSHARLRDLFVPVILYPVIIPLLITAVTGTSAVLAGEVPREIAFMAGFDIILVTASALLFEYVMEDPS
jgi:heme exporter protein B